MIDWATVSPALKDLLSELAIDVRAGDPGAPPFEGEWSGRGKTLTHPAFGQLLELQVVSLSPVGGNYETAYEYDADTNLLDEVTCGLQRLTLQVKAESHNHTDANWSIITANRIHTRLQRRRSRGVLRAAGLELVDPGVIFDVTARRANGRVLNASAFQPVFYVTFRDVDSVQVGWIEKIELTSKLKDCAGNVLPSPPNFTDRLIPPN